MAAPLQVIWVFSNFLHAASSSASDVVPLHPQLILEEYKAQIRMVLCQSPHRRQKFLWASATYWSLSHLRSISRHFLGLHGQSRTIFIKNGGLPFNSQLNSSRSLQTCLCKLSQEQLSRCSTSTRSERHSTQKDSLSCRLSKHQHSTLQSSRKGPSSLNS